MIRLLILLLVAFTVQGCNGTETKEDIRKEVLIDYYENGQIKEETPYVDNIKQGTYKVFYEDGSLKSKGNYTNDQINGDVEFYYPSGELMEVQNYSAGNVLSYVRYDKEGKEIKKGAFPKMSISKDKGENMYFVLDLKHYVYDSVQVIIGPLDSVNQYVIDTVDVVKCPSGFCEYLIDDAKLGSNVITGVVQDIRYEDGHVVEQNVVPFKFDHYIKEDIDSASVER